MEQTLGTYSKILVGNLCPLQDNRSEQKFGELLHDLQAVALTAPPLYELRFPKPLNNKRKYYTALIRRDAETFLNEVHNKIKNAFSGDERKFHVHMALSETITPKLKDVSKRIAENSFTEQSLMPGIQGHGQKGDAAYIFFLLKWQLIRLYLEVQNNFTEFVTADPYTQEELHHLFFGESLPAANYLEKAPEPPGSSMVTYNEAPKPEEPFEPKHYDFRPEPPPGGMNYDVMIRDKQLFMAFEKELKAQDLIDNQYNFKKDQGNRKEMAAAYHTLIDRGYFNKKIILTTRIITPLMIRRFLDHRYNATLQKQFNMWDNDKEGLKDFVDHHRWLDRLPFC